MILYHTPLSKFKIRKNENKLKNKIEENEKIK